MKVLVIGGGGNIGLDGVIPALHQFGHEITVVTRRLLKLDGVTCICADCHAANFAAEMRALKFDALIAMVTFDAEGAVKLLECGARQIIFISTVCVMGGQLAETPANERTLLNPITTYGIDKYCAELVLHAQKNIPVTIFRPASITGPRFPLLRQLAVEPDMRWIWRILDRREIAVADDGMQLWHWCSADDAGIAIAAAVGRERCYGKTYILTRPEPVTWQWYHTTIAEILGREAQIVHIPADAIIASGVKCGLLIEQSRWPQYFDLSQLLRDIGEFNPVTNFATMVERCISRMPISRDPNSAAQDAAEDQLIASWHRRGMFEDFCTVA